MPKSLLFRPAGVPGKQQLLEQVAGWPLPHCRGRDVNERVDLGRRALAVGGIRGVKQHRPAKPVMACDKERGRSRQSAVVPEVAASVSVV